MAPPAAEAVGCRGEALTRRLEGVARLAAQTLAAPVAGVWRAGRCVAAHGAATAALSAVAPPAPEGFTVKADLPGYGFAVGAPLSDGAARIEGAIWVLDGPARALTGRERDLLGGLAALAGALCAAAGPPLPAERKPDAEADRTAAIEGERMRVRFEAIFENTDAVVFIKRRNGELLAANRRYQELAGRPDVVGRTDHELYGRETGDALRAHDLRLFETGEPFNGEERVILPGGEEVIYLSSKFLIHDPALNDMVLCGIATDITAQKRLQASLEASRREAEQAALAKAQFLATMSHEIRTPMNGVLGMLALLTATTLDARQREMAQVARDSASNLLTLLNDILDYARIETHELILSSIPFDLRAAINAAVAPARKPASDKDLSLAVAISADAPRMVVGDPARFRQILGNLLDNAVKFTERGGVRVEAEACGDQLRIVVRDTGVGVPAAAQARIFVGFSQGDSSTTRRYGGVGLGLTICKQLVEAMGGAIGVDSAEGAGAAFWFTLPLNPTVQSA